MKIWIASIFSCKKTSLSSQLNLIPNDRSEDSLNIYKITDYWKSININYPNHGSRTHFWYSGAEANGFGEKRTFDWIRKIYPVTLLWIVSVRVNFLILYLFVLLFTLCFNNHCLRMRSCRDQLLLSKKKCIFSCTIF